MYELRLIIYEVIDIKSSEKYPDIYVKASLTGLDIESLTDVHKNVPDKKAFFSYRLVMGNLPYLELE